MKSRVYIVLILTIISCENAEIRNINTQEFIEIASNISTGWNEGNAKLVAQHFDKDAIYEEPPKKQFYKGQKDIYEFFGGSRGFDIPMKMKWHNLAFSENNQIGFGEYTFTMNNQYHGIVVMKLKNGKITKWREYQYQSTLNWDEFTGESNFESLKQ